MNAYWIVVGVLTVAGASLLAWLRYVKLRRSGMLPKPGQATLADVGRLVAAGERAHAVGCYRRIQSCTLAEAKRAVDELYPAA
jgi:hypothetical protein